MRCGGHPVDTDLERMNRIVDRGGHPERSGQAVEFVTTWRDVGGRFVHGVGQQRPLGLPRPGQLLGKPGRAGCSHLGGRRGQAIGAQLGRRIPRRESGRRRPGWPGPGRQRGQNGDGAAGMRECPRGCHRGTDRDPADGDGALARGVVQGGQIAVDQPVRSLAPGSPHRAPTLRKGPENARWTYIVVGSGSGQQHGRDTAQIDSHASILPGH